MESFASRLNTAMKNNKIKQIELSRMTGLDKSLISNYLKGTYQAKQSNLHLIASALNVSEAWLMGYDVPMERATAKSGSTRPTDSRFSKEDSDLAFALWGDSSDIDDKDIEEVKRFAAFIREKKTNK